MKIFAGKQRLTRMVNERLPNKSVFIRVHPWLRTLSFKSVCEI